MPNNENDYQSYMLRIWRVKDDRGSQWRITLEDTLSGKLQSFSTLEALFVHLQSVDELNKEKKERKNHGSNNQNT